MKRRRIVIGACVLVIGLLDRPLAAEPLHQQIDRLIAQAHVGPVAGPSTDAEFLRRVYLDLVGTIPTSAEARKFLDDKSPGKRVALIDRLLDSPRYARHMAGVFDVMLMERRGGGNVNQAQWLPYLREAFEKNKPYNQLAAEILGSDGTDPKQRAPAKFILDRGTETNLLTREVGRIFFGMDLQCAQCHDHPIIDDYLQADYYGIFAFLNRTYLFKAGKNPSVLAEKGEGEVSFKSVFTGDGGNTKPRLPGGEQITEPTFKKGEEYKVKPAKNVRPIPKYSRRAQLAKLATDGSNAAFNRNIVNRLWAHMMGRGLVHPVDYHHSDNPPAHPELLEVLAERFVAMKFDMRVFLRELALSQTYQRSFQMPSDLSEHVAAARKRLPSLQADQAKVKAAVTQTQQLLQEEYAKVETAEKAVVPLAQGFKKAGTVVAAAKKTADGATKAHAEVGKQLAAKQDVAKTLAEAVAKTTAAVKKLPGDKELSEATRKFQARSQQAAGEVAALLKTVAARLAAVKTAAAKLSEAEQAAAAVSVKLNAAKKQETDARQQLAAAEAKFDAAHAAAKLAEFRLKQIKPFLVYGDQRTQVLASRTAAEKAKAELAVARQAADKATAEVAKAQANLATAEKANTQAAKALADAQSKLAKNQEVLKLLGDSIAKAELARQKLPDDQDLAQAIAKLKSRSAALNKELAENQKTVTARQAADKTAADQFAKTKKASDAARAALASLQQRIQSAEAQIKQAEAKAAAGQAGLDKAYDELTEHWTKQFAVASVKPLSPEQLTWALMQATGLADRQRTATAAAINKKSPLKPEEQKDAAKVAARAREIEQAVYDKLNGSTGEFVKLFAAAAGQPQDAFFATVDQALFFANGARVRSWLTPGGGNLTDRLIKLKDDGALAEELYLSVLTRRPTAEEAADVVRYLAARPKERNVAIQEMAWALVTSAEFRFSH